MTIPATTHLLRNLNHTGQSWVPDWNKAQAAIDLRVPRSGIPELDAMIRESRRLDMATAAMKHCRLVRTIHNSESVFHVYEIADALLAARRRRKEMSKHRILFEGKYIYAFPAHGNPLTTKHKSLAIIFGETETIRMVNAVQASWICC